MTFGAPAGNGTRTMSWTSNSSAASCLVRASSTNTAEASSPTVRSGFSTSWSRRVDQPGPQPRSNASRGAFMPLRRSNSLDSGSYISASRRSRALARRLSPKVYLLAAAAWDSPSPTQPLSPKENRYPLTACSSQLRGSSLMREPQSVNLAAHLGGCERQQPAVPAPSPFRIPSPECQAGCTMTPPVSSM